MQEISSRGSNSVLAFAVWRNHRGSYLSVPLLPWPHAISGVRSVTTLGGSSSVLYKMQFSLGPWKINMEGL